MVEIQYHPTDISRPVRYFFVRSARVRVLVAAALGSLVLVATALALSPRGVRSILSLVRYKAALSTNTAENRTLAAEVEHLERLQQRLEQAQLLQAQIVLMLGFAADEGYAGGSAGTSDGGVATTALRRAEELAQAVDGLLATADGLEIHLRRHRQLIEAVPSVSPLLGDGFVLSSPYGNRISPFTGARDFHPGIDLAAVQGTPVLATGNASVAFAGRVPSRKDVAWWRMGNTVVLDHAGAYHTVYAHLHTIAVRKGQNVQRGDPIATVGNTGWSTSPHLHYEVRLLQAGTAKSTPLDPRIFILDHGWKRQEDLLAARRWAPPSQFDTLPIPAR